jgi:uncharacterized protein
MMDIQTYRSSYKLIQRLGILVNSEIESEFQDLYPNLQGSDEETLIGRLKDDLTDEEIERHICRNRNLILDITEECNFRCKYCAFSGIYESNRTHNPKKMV